VLLAGCRDRELSNEYWAKSEGQEGVWHGALTYFTLQTLRQMAPETTYAELHERVATQVNAIYRDQTPQCEGNRDRVVFKGLQVQRDPFISIRRVEGNIVTLGAGLVHGLCRGSELALYPPETRTRQNLPTVPLATVTVIEVTATSARARVEGETNQVIPLHARALITKQVYTGMSQTIALYAEEGEENQLAIDHLREAIQKATPNGKPSPYLEIVSGHHATAELRVVASAGKLQIYNANGVLLVEPTDIDGQSKTASVLHALENIVRYRTILALKNEDQVSQLVGKVKLRLRRYMPGQLVSQAQELPAEAIGPGGELTVYFYADQPDHNLYVVDVINESPLHIYPHVFTLSPDYSIQRLYPRKGEQEAVKPDFTFAIPDQLTFFLPPGWDASRDYLKIIVTTVPTDLQVLEQQGLTVPPPSRESNQTRKGVQSHLNQLLDAVLSNTRFAGPASAPIGEDWAVVELPITTVRAFGTVKLDASTKEVPLSDGLTLIKPESFQGEVTVTTWGQASRGVDGDPALEPPPGLVQFPDLFQPVGRSGTRSVGPAGLVVAFNVDESSRHSITKDDPLYLKLPSAPGEEGTDLFAVAFDGEDYLLVGSSEYTDILKVIYLPPTTVAPTRGIGHAIKLFLYKKIGRYTPIVGLHCAELEDGKVVYSEIQGKQFQPGQRVAVFIHGFTSDTRWMIQGLAQFLRKEVLPYDHFLTWDYESFGTSIQEIGTQFALTLQQQCGFAENDGITVHIYAHSMGCLVARYMIELAEGYQFVDRLVMAGSPNQGTTLATLSRGAVYLATALINHFSAIPPVGVIDWALKELSEQGMGWGDLIVNSQVEQQLNALKKPSNIPYLALVGENVPDEQERNRLNRLARKVLHDTLENVFGEPNDMVIGVSSMKGVRGGTYPLLSMNMLSCDHFHYYDIPQGLMAVKQWIQTVK
jgi:pimeloyl-ACP methyl ester carboxylesterase